jgi:hypothetical protein
MWPVWSNLCIRGLYSSTTFSITDKSCILRKKFNKS